MHGLSVGLVRACGGADTGARRSVAKSLGLLLVNKQIHEESTDMLYRKNTFALKVLVWRHEGQSFPCTHQNPCAHPDLPCFMSNSNFHKVQRLQINVIFPN